MNTMKMAKNDKNKKNNKKPEKKSDKNNNKDGEGKYSEQVLCRPNVVKMRKTLIFTSNPDKIKEGLNILSQDEKEKLNENIEKIKGEIPEPRDGQTACVDGTNIYIFGGDRFKFPFNDLFVLDTVSLPLLPIKENKREKREKEKAKEEKEEREKLKQKQEEMIKEEKAENEEDEEKKSEVKDNEEKKSEAKKDNEEQKEEEKKSEPKKEDEKIKDEEDELLTLEEKIVYRQGEI